METLKIVKKDIILIKNFEKSLTKSCKFVKKHKGRPKQPELLQEDKQTKKNCLKNYTNT